MNNVSYKVLFGLLAFALVLSQAVSAYASPAAVNLGNATNFAILTESGIDNSANPSTTTIIGDIGASPIGGTAITGVLCARVNGTIYTVDNTGPACKVIDSTLLGAAVGSMEAAITDANGRPVDDINLAFNAGVGCVAGTCDLAGLTFAPGVYTFTGPGNVVITNDITLNGSATDRWIFIIPGTLDISSSKKVLLTGAVSANVFWSVAGATTLGTSSTFEGTILEAGTPIAIQTGATLNGRALSKFAVTLDAATVSLSAVTDTTPPVITLIGAADVTVQAGSAYTDAGASATDNLDGNLTGSIITVNPVNTAALGNYTVTYDVTDAHGNHADQVNRTVRVIDTTAPVITMNGASPINVTVGSAYTDAGANASDNLDGNLTSSIITTVNPVINTSVVGTYTVTYDVTDAHGNAATQVTRTVHVVDITAPVIAAHADILGVEATSSSGASVNYTNPTATDNYDANVTVSCAPASGSTFGLGNSTVTCNAQDAAHNAATPVTFTVQVVDTTAPVIAFSTPASNSSYNSRTLSIAVTVTEADLNSSLSNLTVIDSTGSIVNYTTLTGSGTYLLAVPADGTYNITALAVDNAGLSSISTNSNITVNSTIPAGARSAVNLGTAGNFVILAKSAVSVTGTASVVGDVGLSPAAASYITGFGLIADSSNRFSTSSLVAGKIYAADYATPTPATMTTAVSDMETAYTDAAGRTLPDYTELGAGNIGGMTLAPGLYKWGTGVTIPTDVTLDCQGNTSAVFIFQIAQTLDISNGKKVILIGGCQASNIFWQVAGQTTLGTTSDFKGTILDQTAIVLNTGAALNGSALAQTAVTLDANNVSSSTALRVTLIIPAVPAPTQSSSGSGGSNGGGSPASYGGSYSSQPSTTYQVDVGLGKTCNVSLSRSLSSGTNLSVLTTTLTNNGGSGCSMTNFVFADGIPATFAPAANVNFSPNYTSLQGSTVGFSFPSFAGGESKTITYSVNGWARPSSTNDFTQVSLTAKKQVAAPVQPVTAQPTTPKVQNVAPAQNPTLPVQLTSQPTPAQLGVASNALYSTILGFPAWATIVVGILAVLSVGVLGVGYWYMTHGIRGKQSAK